ncbi:PREDICTED: inositol 1,4,5-trisphosphate receptor-like [Amphimedon queenslandica]|uniref:Uncharacterized protein n=1 Tax=Amphimedon queenslandica TaxID=400682 RepID=A0AAN0IZR8_AMPQE|nr:PREDICTED: inositol 1,4,5-trisphosphate receptor-like [Amphimedon queenslandica]|eukprot:XP_019849951.1 PREDICTED: inositol 1,4,5-trisphosphate receptor-like [Amphimedon queenslandica]
MAVLAEAGHGSLRFGDTVLFLIKTKDYQGYVYSELSSSPFLTVYNLKEHNEKNPDFPNIAFASFKIMAPNKYKAKQQLKQAQLDPESQEHRNAVHAFEMEEAENKLEQKRRFGSPVLYGDSIQLQHVASKKFVKVCSEASKTQSNNLLVSLSEENFEECIFKILPRYKVRSEGDEVRYNDQLKIENIKNQGQYLHCSGPNHTLETARFNVLTDCFELNLSATESALTLIPHYSPSVNKHPDKALRAGTCVRLFHSVDECYIVAEGSFAFAKESFASLKGTIVNERSDPIIEDVHCRVRRVDSRKHNAPSTSSNTYWQIEKQEDPRSGDVIAWMDRCRLKHLPTRCYLAVVEDMGQWKVTLKEKTSDNDLDTIFSFSPLIEEGEEVLLESYALIQHRRSGQWLHLEKKNSYTRKGFDPKAEGLAGLEWDSAELLMLTTRKDRGDYDSFTLQEVTEDLVDKFNYVAGIVPVLTGYIKQLHSKTEGKQKQLVRVKNALVDLKNWISDHKEKNRKNNQKLLRNLRVLEQLHEILKFAEDITFKGLSLHITICCECYNVIKIFLEGDSRKNENYLARFIAFFQQHVRKKLNAEEVLVEFVQNNITIVSKMADTQLSHMIEQFLSTKDPKLLDFLGSLCVCSNRPIPSTQNRLLQELVKRHGEEKFLKTKLDRASQEIYCYYSSSPDQRVSLKALSKDNNEKFYHLLKGQLYLMATLCQGNNKKAISALVHTEENPDGYISFDEAITCAKETDIDSKLRKYYIKLILVMFVDCGNNRSFLDNLCYSFVYDDLVQVPYSESGGSQVEALTGAENEHFPALKDWILDTISNNTNLRCESKENSLLKLVLDVLGHLVRYGYYDDIQDVDDLLGPLTELLNGKTDLPSERKMSEVDFKSSTRKKDMPENKGVFDVKVKALEVMELLYRFKFYVKLQKFMYDFQQTQKPERKGRIEAIIDELTPVLLDTLSKLVDTDSEDDDENDKKLYSREIMGAVQEHINYLCDGNAKGGGFAPPNAGGLSLELVLLDLSGYECDELVTGSLNLLTHMYFFEEELFSKAQQTQLLKCDRSLNDYKTVKNKILPDLWQLLRVDASGPNQEKLVSILRQLQSLCVFSSSHLPNKQNQIMLDNFGIVSDIMSFLFEKSDGRVLLKPAAQGDSSGSVGEDLHVFNNCFLLLQYLSIDNMKVKKRIFSRLDDLLQMKLPNTTLPFLADLITEVFTGGPELIMKVKDDQIEKIFEIIISCNYPMAQAQFLVTLEAIVKIEEVDLPLGQNQATIINNFCKLRETVAFCPDLLGKSSTLRIEILNSSEGSSCPDPRLQLLLNLTDMLAACAEGGDLFIESVFQNIFGIDDLIEIISSELPPNCKRPFLRFLTIVYMNTDGDNSSYQNSLSHGALMWAYLSHLANLLENVSKVLSCTSSSDIKILKQDLQTNSRHKVSQSSYPPTTSAAEPVPSIGIAEIPNVTDSHGHLVPGLLEYLADGVIPFLHTFYSHFYDPNSANHLNDCTISANILRSLVDLSKDLTAVLFSDKHVYMFQETISALMNYSEIREKSTVSKEQSIHTIEFIGGRAPRKMTSSVKQSEKTDSAAYEEFLEEYAEQEKLNKLFNCFSQRYHCSYMGPNTASHQIGSTVHCKIEYSDEGEELPMGASFQELIKIYHIDKSCSKKHPAERLLKQIEISVSRSDQLGEAEQMNQDKLDLRCLQILRALIHNKIKHIDPELKQRDPKEFRKKCKDTVVPVQESIQSFNNAISRVIPLLLHPDEKISKEALALMKALLFSGNKEVQEGLIKAVKQSHEEKLFLNFKKRLEAASLNFKEIAELKAQLKKRKKLQRYSSASPPVSARLTGEHASIGFESEAAVTYTSGKDVIIPMEEIVGAHEDEDPLLSTGSIKRSKASGIASPGLESATELNRNAEFKLLSDILHHDALWINLVLEVIGLMCDGQNRTLQDYLREQLDNYRTINVVAEVVAFLHTFATDLSLTNLEQISTVIQSLIELSPPK